jgi:hypothetical protein
MRRLSWVAIKRENQKRPEKNPVREVFGKRVGREKFSERESWERGDKRREA